MKVLSRALAVIVVLAAAAGPAQAAPETFEKNAEGFIASLADQAVQSLTVPDISRQERINRFRTLFNDHFAVKSIGRWILGKYWRAASEAERAEYLTLFEDLMVVSYVDRFANYAGESLKIEKSVPNGENTATVFSTIQRGSGGPIAVNWRVGGRDDVFKVADVVVEGTSMSATLRSEFASIIRQKGGEVAGLLEALRNKTAALKQEAKAAQ